MRAERRAHGPLLPLLVAAAWLAGVATPAWSQEGDAQQTPAAEPSPESPDLEEGESVARRSAGELSDVEYLLRMQQAVTSDEAKLERLRNDLARRQEFLDLLTGQMSQFQTNRDEMTSRLGELEEGSAEGEALKDDIRRLEQQYERFNRHASLTFEAEGILRQQIENLQTKIVTDHRALAVFRSQGTGPTEPTGEAEAAPIPGPPAASSAAPVLPIPGAPLPSPSPSPAALRAALLPQTPEQIEARQELARKSQAARVAEAAVTTFVERKEALEVQIGLEDKLLKLDGEALENLEGFLGERRARLEKLEASGLDATDLAQRQAQLERLSGEIERVTDEVNRRRVELDALRDRLVYATGELNRVTAFAEARREEAESARNWLIWIESPLYPGNLYHWVVERGPRVLAVLILAGLLLLLIRLSLRRIARAVVTKSRKARSTAVNRADTLALSFQSLATTLILAACVLLVLQEAGLDVRTVLGGAAILGVAVAFGAQNLMRDYFTGFMMLLEDQYELGDLVTIGSITGTVERVNMRVTMLRDLEGRVHFVPNGQIGSLTNRTYDWARALVDIPVGPGEDVDRVMATLLEVARDLKADPEWADEIVDEPQMLGVDKFTESGVVIKLMLKTQPERMFPIRRELLRRVKKAFDEAGIEPGFPQRVVRQAPDSRS
jgi:small conductance mechanosensitive channel